MRNDWRDYLPFTPDLAGAIAFVVTLCVLEAISRLL